MRIDKFLKVSRILKRRTVAQSACDGGKVSVNGIEAKPSKQLKIGDTVKIEFASGAITFKVMSLNEKANKEQASELFQIIE